MATQMNTFVVAMDFGTETVTVPAVEAVVRESFDFASANYSGWPRGFQSSLAAIPILISSSVGDDAILYCRDLGVGKKWAGASVPVVVDTEKKQVHYFERTPAWGAIYYPFFREMIDSLIC